MASKEEKYKIINDLFQNIFKVTQNDSVTKASTSEMKAAMGDGKWIIKIPGLCKITIRQDVEDAGIDLSSEAEDAPVPLEGEADMGFNAPMSRSARKPEAVGDSFINDVARNYE